MTEKQALISQIDNKIAVYERRMQRAREEWESEPTQERFEYYIQLRGKWLGLGEARKLISYVL